LDDVTSSRASILLFDGECNLCNGAVRFVTRRDRSRQFRFASLQSTEADALLTRFGLADTAPDTVVLIDDEGAHLRSAAALRVARRLGGAWPLLYALILVPRIVRDGVYDFVARRRHRWFGSSEVCSLPDRSTPSQGRLK
jgi:predicted DCC family thiol-disulfide oxidoreductase YuxK